MERGKLVWVIQRNLTDMPTKRLVGRYGDVGLIWVYLMPGVMVFDTREEAIEYLERLRSVEWLDPKSADLSKAMPATVYESTLRTFEAIKEDVAINEREIEQQEAVLIQIEQASKPKPVVRRVVKKVMKKVTKKVVRRAGQ